MAAPFRPRLRQLADRVHVPKVLAPIRFDDDRRLGRGRIFPFPEEKLLTVALKTNLYEHVGDGSIGSVDLRWET